jgi:hypothetical protein
VRKITALTAAAGLLVTLAACTTPPSGDCTPLVGSGNASSIITASGALGAEPKADFPTPLITDALQASVLTTGEGATVHPDQYVAAQVTLYDTRNGDRLISTSYNSDEALILRAGQSTSTVTKVLACQSVGSRIAVAALGSDIIGFGGLTEASVNPEATFVAVFDIQRSILGKAYGVDQIAAEGLPSVVTTPNGQPGLTVPKEPAPTTVQFSVLKQSDGPVLKEGQLFYAHYLRVDWDDPKAVFSSKSTWNDYGVPELLQLAPIDLATGAGLTPGLLQALTGQRVGSQVLVVVPPAYSFPDGYAPAGVDSDTTLVYVIDILGVVE